MRKLLALAVLALTMSVVALELSPASAAVTSLGSTMTGLTERYRRQRTNADTRHPSRG